MTARSLPHKFVAWVAVLLAKLTNVVRWLRARSYDWVEFLPDDDAVLRGWWIVSRDPDGSSFDSVGPYETHARAWEIVGKVYL